MDDRNFPINEEPLRRILIISDFYSNKQTFESQERRGIDPMYREKKAINIALYGLLIALAMVLSFVETLIPIPIPVPGVKLGLANLVTVVGLYLIGIPGTIAVTLIRIVLVGLSFGNPYSMIYGLSGSFLSLFVMAILKKTGKLSQIGISVLGGIAHNIGQITFAAVIVQTAGVFYYLPFLLAAGCIAGTLIGVVGGIITERLMHAMRGIKK